MDTKLKMHGAQVGRGGQDQDGRANTLGDWCHFAVRASPGDDALEGLCGCPLLPMREEGPLERGRARGWACGNPLAGRREPCERLLASERNEEARRTSACRGRRHYPIEFVLAES